MSASLDREAAYAFRDTDFQEVKDVGKHSIFIFESSPEEEYTFVTRCRGVGFPDDVRRKILDKTH